MSTNALSDKLFLTIFEKSASALLLKADEHFTVVAVSDNFLEFARINRQEVLEKSFLSAFASQGNTAQSLLNSFKQVIRTKEQAYLQLADYGIFNSSIENKDQLVWTINNKPVLDESGEVAYIIHTPTNTTVQVNKEVARQAHLQSDTLFRNLVMQAPIAIGVCRGEDFVIETANKHILDIWCKTDEIIGKKLELALPELAGQPFLQFLRDVLSTGKAHYGYETPANLVRGGRMDTYYFNFVFYPLEEQGQITGIIVVATEVTDQVKARQLLEDSEKQFRNLVLQSPVAMGIMRGPDQVIEVYNSQLLKLWGKQEEEVMGRPLLEAFPELEGQPYPDILKGVFETGVPYSAEEMPAIINTDYGVAKYFLDFTYRPLFEMGKVSGIMLTAVNVTSQVEARHKLEIAEERLRLATEATGLGTFDLDLVTDEVAYSPRLAEMFGHPGDYKLSHAHLKTLIHEEDQGIVARAFEHALKTGLYFYEVRNVWPDGSVHWIRTHGSIIFDRNGKAVRLVGTVIDVTSERYLINNLVRSEENMRMAAEAAELGTFDWDVSANKLVWDERHKRLFGVAPDFEPTYDLYLNMLYPDDRRSIEKSVQGALNRALTGGDYDVDFRIIKHDNKSLRWMRAKGKALFNDRDVAVRFVGTVVDITDRKQDEIRKNDFIAMASHELKTPLTSLKAYVQMMHATARRTDNQFFSTSLQKAENQVDKMTKLIYGFLDLSKIESGKLQLDMQRFDINEAVNEAIADVRPIAQNYNIVFEPAGSFYIRADREKISQVLINLLNNAVKYSPKETTVTVMVKAVGDNVVVSVNDQGIGINTYDAKNIFQRFYRVQNEKMKGFSGFGIGLYLAAEIVNLHGGTIWVESEQGSGSTFYFQLRQA